MLRPVVAFVLVGACGRIGFDSEAISTGDARQAHSVLYAPSAQAILGFVLDPTSGTPTPIGSFPVGDGPIQLAVHPSGRFAYVADATSSDVVELAIDATTGELSPLPGSPITGNSLAGPTGIAIDPGGAFAYVSNGGNGTISTFAIDATTGVLSAAGTTPINSAGSRAPSAVAIDPSGTFLYAGLNVGFCELAAFRLTAGTLTQLAGSPFTLAPTRNGCTAWQLVFSPNGRWLFVSDGGQGVVAWAAFDATTGALAGQPFQLDYGSSFDEVFDPTGTHYYLASDSNPVALVAVAVDPTTGAQQEIQTISTVQSGAGAAMDPSGHFLYVTDTFAGVYSWQVAGDGTLAPIPGSPLAAATASGHATLVTLTY